MRPSERLVHCNKAISQATRPIASSQSPPSAEELERLFWSASAALLRIGLVQEAAVTLSTTLPDSRWDRPVPDAVIRDFVQSLVYGGSVDAAFRVLDKAQTASRTIEGAALSRVTLLAGLGQLEEATAVRDKPLASGPGFGDGVDTGDRHAADAILSLARETFPQAEMSARAGLEQAPDSSLLWRLLSVSLREQGKLGKAVQAADQAESHARARHHVPLTVEARISKSLALLSEHATSDQVQQGLDQVAALRGTLGVSQLDDQYLGVLLDIAARAALRIGDAARADRLMVTAMQESWAVSLHYMGSLVLEGYGYAAQEDRLEEALKGCLASGCRPAPIQPFCFWVPGFDQCFGPFL